MSEKDQSCSFVPWLGPMCTERILIVVVLSSNTEILEKICSELQKEHDGGDYRWKLVMIRLVNLEEIEKNPATTGLPIDFVILGLDTSYSLCLDWARTAISQVPPNLRNRVVLVNASGLPPLNMAIPHLDLLKFKSDFDVDMLNADVNKSHERKNLARRLLKEIEVTIGVSTGVPMLHI